MQGKDLAPSFWLEDITGSDASVQKCLVFRSVAGVDYTVEVSNDLIQWNSESALYGLGHEFVVPVLEVSPPGPANPQTPPPPRPKLVSIWMQRSSAPGGGTILSWISLANQMPVQVVIAGSLSPDWLEFEIAANPTHPFHDTANPFSNDADNDGTPDQLDADGDGIPDGWDADREKSAVDWNKTAEPRFAWFEFQAPMSPQGYPQIPLHVTDLGYVVFPYGIWSKGSYSSMAMEGNGMSSCTILGMNNSWGGQIIGHGAYDEDGDGYPDRTCHAHWSGPTGEPQPVKAGNNFASLRYPHINNPSRFLAGDGGFIANQSAASAPARWLLPTLENDSYQTSPTEEWAQLGSSANFIWGSDKAMIGQELMVLPNYYRELVTTPSGSIIACTVGDPPAVYKNDNWQVESSLPHLMDFSYKGFGATFSPVQVWSNGRSQPLQIAAPGLDKDWAQKARLIDMSDEGNLLVSRDAPNDEGADAYALGVPIMVEDDIPATGVDNVSYTSREPGTGIDDKIWIMALSGGENTVRFRTTASSISCPLAISTPAATFAPSTLENPNQTVEVGGGFATVSGDSDLRISNNGMAPRSWPVGIKTMKKRFLTLKVYKVTEKGTNGQADNTADLVPTESDLETYLNDVVFGPQLNLKFDVDLVAEPLLIDWKTADDPSSWLELGQPDTNSSDQQLFVDEVVDPSSGKIPADIVVFLVGTNVLLGGDFSASGATNRAERVCWVVGDAIGSPSDWRNHSTLDDVTRAIAHEIGHILVDYGHPDASRGLMGHAPLPGTRHSDRLMVSGLGGGPNPGHLLVKKEWDEAEVWLSERENIE